MLSFKNLQHILFSNSHVKTQSTHSSFKECFSSSCISFPFPACTIISFRIVSSCCRIYRSVITYQFLNILKGSTSRIWKGVCLRGNVAITCHSKRKSINFYVRRKSTAPIAQRQLGQCRHDCAPESHWKWRHWNLPSQEKRPQFSSMQRKL